MISLPCFWFGWTFVKMEGLGPCAGAYSVSEVTPSPFYSWVLPAISTWRAGATVSGGWGPWDFLLRKIIFNWSKLSKHWNPLCLFPEVVQCYRPFPNFGCHFSHPSCMSRTRTTFISRSKGRILIMLLEFQNPRQKSVQGPLEILIFFPLRVTGFFSSCDSSRKFHLFFHGCSCSLTPASFPSWWSSMPVWCYWAAWKSRILPSVRQLPRNQHENRIR